MGGGEGETPHVVFWGLNCAVAPTVDQRQRSGWALEGIKSR